MAKYVMLQGTSSNVGKSVMAAALCRIFSQEGIRVAPFKAQNMALNSYVTKSGGEMGRAQVVQAEAAGIEPQVEMNPVLLKPMANSNAQVIVMGKPLANMTAGDYFRARSLQMWDKVTDALKVLDGSYELLVIEGAGSPAEINLKANDIVNMKVARHLKAPVLLIADIDRGGAIAYLVGTLELLDEEERKLVKGFIINKFRGDKSLLQPAVDFLEKKTGKPVLGIVPYISRLNIDAEDSLALEELKAQSGNGDVKIAVVQTPQISNFTDFDSLAAESDVSLYYASDAESLGDPDVIILPGSRNTVMDLQYIRAVGLEKKIKELLEKETSYLIGICGGYQMLGKRLLDPGHIESAYDSIDGIGLLDLVTTFGADKYTSQVEAVCTDLLFAGQKISSAGLYGYEIHMGDTVFGYEAEPHPLRVVKCLQGESNRAEGTVRADGRVFGTYIHGIFDNDEFRRAIINAVRINKGLPALTDKRNTKAEKQRSYNRLADAVRESLDMVKIRRIIGFE